ncbi:unnamed protein product [Chrysodeixis includens]|uniref:unspecific monooxygenase n=1 Tax=Chrysodeixis includens TaxID=689277 RepID=A0A9N8KUN0_CHRIL|nr:unnamed protein product [Chrysodeixis includens]
MLLRLFTKHPIPNHAEASCAFGLKVNSHTEVDNQFYTMGKEATNFNFRQMIMFFLLVNMPKVIKFLKWEMISEGPRNFFRNLVLDTMKDRELRHIIRPDMIHLLMEAKKGKLSHEDVKPNDTAAGFATVEESSVGQKELNRELLRRWPPAVAMDRVCNKDYNLGRPNDKADRDFIVSSRFALCELKVMTYQVLRQMVLSPSEKTCIPAELSTDSFNIRLQGGHWLRFRLRE